MKIRSAGESQKERLDIYDQIEKGELSLGKSIAMMRRALGLSQGKFAKMIRINARVLSDFERGVGNPTFETLTKIAAPFGLIVAFRRKK